MCSGGSFRNNVFTFDTLSTVPDCNVLIFLLQPSLFLR